MRSREVSSPQYLPTSSVTCSTPYPPPPHPVRTNYRSEPPLNFYGATIISLIDEQEAADAPQPARRPDSKANAPAQGQANAPRKANATAPVPRTSASSQPGQASSARAAAASSKAAPAARSTQQAGRAPTAAAPAAAAPPPPPPPPPMTPAERIPGEAPMEAALSSPVHARPSPRILQALGTPQTAAGPPSPRRSASKGEAAVGGAPVVGKENPVEIS